jgi:hypothetical protein
MRHYFLRIIITRFILSRHTLLQMALTFQEERFNGDSHIFFHALAVQSNYVTIARGIMVPVPRNPLATPTSVSHRATVATHALAI